MAEIKDLLNPLYSYGLISGQASDSIRKYLEGNSAKGTSKPFTRGKTTNAYGDALVEILIVLLSKILLQLLEEVLNYQILVLTL